MQKQKDMHVQQSSKNIIDSSSSSEHISPRPPGRFDGLRIRLVLVAFAFGAYVVSFILLSKIYGKGGATAAVLLVATVS